MNPPGDQQLKAHVQRQWPCQQWLRLRRECSQDRLNDQCCQQCQSVDQMWLVI
jgi:hypothetical protein